jgi:formate dehydrogenase assembly factor FdhD
MRPLPFSGATSRRSKSLAGPHGSCAAGCGQGDYDGATKEMNLAQATAPDPAKPTVEALVKRLEAKQDINNKSKAESSVPMAGTVTF